MATTFTILGYAHWLGVAAILGGYFLSLQTQVAHPLMVWGARLQLLLGLLLVGLAEMQDLTIDHMAVGIKLLIGLGVVALCEMSRIRSARGKGQPALVHAAFVLGCINFFVARMYFA